MKCPLCEKLYKNIRSITNHLRMKHNVRNSKDIIFKYHPELFRNCKGCGKLIKHYKTNSQSRKSCNRECDRLSKIGQTQSVETINKRIANTDQYKKEQTRQTTMIKKYGKLYIYPNPDSRSQKISQSLSGKSHSAQHHINVILSKKKNGTLHHTKTTKKKISKSLQKYYSDPTVDRSHLIKGNKTYNCGWYKGFYCRSSYEKKFVDICEFYEIKLQSAETKEFAVCYYIDDKPHYYYPDFYLPELDVIVEIKAAGMRNYGNNPMKYEAAEKQFDEFRVITEADGLFEPERWRFILTKLKMKFD